MGLLQKIFSPFAKPGNNGLAPARACISPAGIAYVLQPAGVDQRVAIAFVFDGGFMDDRAIDPPAGLVAPAALLHQAFSGASSSAGEALSDLGAGISLLPQPLFTLGHFLAPRASAPEAARICRTMFAGLEPDEAALSVGIEQAGDVVRRAASDPQMRITAAMLDEAVDPGLQFDPDKITEADLANVAPADVRVWADRHLVRARLRIAVVGPLAEADAGALVDQLFDDLPQGVATRVSPPHFRPRTQARRLNLNLGGDGPVTLLLAASQRKATTLEDYLAAHMFALILAGDERSRLFDLVRDRAAASYGLGCWADIDASSISMSVSGQLDQAGFEGVLAQVRAAIADLAANGPTAAETQHARDWLRQYQQALTQENQAVAGRLMEMLAAGWSIEAINEVGATIESLNLQAMKSLLDPLASHPIVVIGR